ncbi:MAG: Inner membrane protein YbhL [Alphaproteobacteria bacterium MarineAlpha9_Bin2]|nr:MAG: Inner membrane protein YbhL [Alphaproteobacteria bacterium MarineAlpha9_Bin1]PPR31323.1 MAG: Inner membrane protein YbhL [Alphaproteobacteria bacterium MarineAlpha9_Bin2]
MNIGHFTRNSSTQARARALSPDDVGLRAYMQRIYAYMTAGLAITASVAWLLPNTTIGMAIITSPLSFIAMIAPIGLVLILASRIHKMQAKTAQTMFWILAACYGIFFANIFVQYTGESIFRVFFISSSTFLGASLYGYVTKRSLARLGSFLFMGLIGIIMASVVNIFLGSSPMQFIICIIGVLIFTGLTAYDTQTLKEMYVAGESGETQVKKGVMGALKLYLDFINLFILLLMLLGGRR